MEDAKCPLPLIDELFTSLQGKLYTKLNLLDAYDQLVWGEDSHLKMARPPFTVKPAAKNN